MQEQRPKENEMKFFANCVDLLITFREIRTYIVEKNLTLGVELDSVDRVFGRLACKPP